jgi:hypothetical protein
MFGHQNPFPHELGGGSTLDESIYRALREAVGVGGSADDDAGAEGGWRWCRARMVASAETAFERAILQAFPGSATDHIPVFERLLGISPPAASTDEARRNTIETQLVGRVTANLVGLRRQVREIDPRLQIQIVPFERSDIVYYGRAFLEHVPGAIEYGDGPFSPPSNATQFPAYTTALRLVLLLDQGGTPPTDSEETIMQRAARVLRAALPTPVDFSLSVSDGFLLDETPLDLNSLH